MRVLHLLLPTLVAGLSASPIRVLAQAPKAPDVELSIIAAAVDSLYMRDGAARVVVISPTAVLRREVPRDHAAHLSVSPKAADDIGRRNTMPADIRGFTRFGDRWHVTRFVVDRAS
jgi:hypothetical protein